MAEPKKKNSTKVFDVAKPGKTTPPSSAKPIIITNRPILQDPMVVTSDNAEDKPTGAPPVRRKVQITPLSDDVADTSKDTTEPAKKTAKKTDKKDDDGALVLDLPAEVTGEKPAEPEPENVPAASVEETTEPAVDEAAAPEPAEKAEADTAPAEAESTVPAVADTPKEDVAKDTPAEQTTESTDTPEPDAAPADKAEEATDTPKDDETTKSEQEADESEPESENTEFGLMPSPEMGDEGEVNPDALQKKAEEEAQRIAAEQEKIIASEQYFLPIDAVAHRRAVRHTLIGIIIILVFGALLFLAALDAGLITIDGFPAPTDYL